MRYWPLNYDGRYTDKDPFSSYYAVIYEDKNRMIKIPGGGGVERRSVFQRFDARYGSVVLNV